MSSELWLRVIQVNLFGTLHCSKMVSEDLKTTRRCYSMGSTTWHKIMIGLGINRSAKCFYASRFHASNMQHNGSDKGEKT